MYLLLNYKYDTNTDIKYQKLTFMQHKLKKKMYIYKESKGKA